jgi:histidine ammonia-lyase
MKTLALGRDPLDLANLEAVAHGRLSVTLDADCRRRLVHTRTQVERLLLPNAPNTYGVNTGFGALAEVRIENSDLAQLQLNLVRSHSTGVGNPFPTPIVRAMMLLRANVLTLGTSGVRPDVPELLIGMINAGVHPIIPQKGSVGASGDLAPLAHLALVLVGEGEAEFQGERISGDAALHRAGLNPVVLAPKEGLALINGTQAMTADAALIVARAQRLLRSADVIGALSLEVLLGSFRPFDARIHQARGQLGQISVAANLRHLLADSEINASHHDCAKVQDPYSLRCMPQVHGASRDVIGHAAQTIGFELNAATDNPLVFVDGEAMDTISGGNFHGQPIAFAADFMGIALAELANISERRIEQMVNPALSTGLTPFLTAHKGLESGFMIAQVTAAALVSENKVLAHPASVDSIPSSANREDHVSMGTIAARKAREILGNVEYVLGIELLCASQGLDQRRPLRSSAALEAAHALVRTVIPPFEGDRILHHDIEAATALVRDGRLLTAVEAVSGALP